MAHTLSRGLVAVALAAALGTAAPAAAERPTVPPAERVPHYRVLAPESEELSFGTLMATPRRSITSGVVSRGQRLYLRGVVEDYSRRELLVQRKGCSSCKWRVHHTDRTGKRGWYRTQIGAPRTGSTFWRIKVAPSGGYARSFSAVWETYY